MPPFGGTPICPRCNKAYSAIQNVMNHRNQLYHKPCLTCTTCNKRLDSFTPLEHDKEVRLAYKVAMRRVAYPFLFSHTGTPHDSSCLSIVDLNQQNMSRSKFRHSRPETCQSPPSQ
ncbi:hypothetical protein C8R48DRAFT_614222 [Suillus tomentosus]|nr:hypothetical protein C8R48DRAFT_614222 [Suillus tomentosus]